MTRTQKLIAGICMFVLLLYGMAFFNEISPKDHWANFPTFVMFIFGMICCYSWCGYQLFNYFDEQ